MFFHGQLSGRDLCKSYVRQPHLQIYFNHGSAPRGKLANPFAHHVDELLFVGDYFGSFFYVVAIHGIRCGWRDVEFSILPQ